ISPRPPSVIVVSMRRAPASIAFSTSSFTALAGRSMTSPAAMRLTVASGSRRILIAGRSRRASHLAQVLARQDLALLDRRLVERVDAEREPGHNGLQHEMHEECTHRAFVEFGHVDHPSGAGVANQRFCRRPLLA